MVEYMNYYHIQRVLREERQHIQILQELEEILIHQIMLHILQRVKTMVVCIFVELEAQILLM